MLEQQKKKCPVCGEEFVYMDVRNIPRTCYRKMCRVNYQAYKNRSTIQGNKPDLKEMGIWGPSRDYKKSSDSPEGK